MWPDGSEYSGTFNLQTQDMEGNGILTLAEEVISGEWLASKLHGYGMRKTVNGDLYKGNWVEGCLNG